MTLDPIMLTFRKFESVWNSKNPDELMKYYCSDVIYVDSAIGEREIHGKEKFKNFVTKLWNNHPNINYHVLGYKIKGIKNWEFVLEVKWLAKEDSDSWTGKETVYLKPRIKPPFFKVLYESGFFDPQVRMINENFKILEHKFA
jgi:nuclear transport factor 2 (NTF2) superfamily protein